MKSVLIIPFYFVAVVASVYSLPFRSTRPEYGVISNRFNYSEELKGNETCSLISIVMDESGSMIGEQEFMKEVAVPEILLRLKEVGVDNIFVCSHGFGSIEHDIWGLDRGHFHGCSEGTAEGLLNKGILQTWVSNGRYEDGWQAMDFAINDVPENINGKNIADTCKTLGKNMILVTDESRYDNSCDGHYFHMELLTDKFGGEISWMLKNSTGHTIAHERGYQNNEIVRISKCLTGSDVHTLTFYDGYNDGFCCTHGDGYYKVWYDDSLIVHSPANFDDEISILLPSGISFVRNPPGSIGTAQLRAPPKERLTLQNSIESILDAGYRLNVITNFTVESLQLEGVPIGVTSDGVVVEANSDGSFSANTNFFTEDPMTLLVPNQMAEDYASIAFATGGAAWRLEFLRQGNEFAESFARAFTLMNAKDILDDSFLSSIPSSAPTEEATTMTPTSTPSSSPTSEPPISDGNSGFRNERLTLSMRTIIGSVTSALVAMVALSFLFTRRRAQGQKLKAFESITDAEDDDITSSDENNSEVGRCPTDAEDDSTSFTEGIARIMEKDTSFKWENDTDHLIDLSDLTGDFV